MILRSMVSEYRLTHHHLSLCSLSLVALSLDALDALSRSSLVALLMLSLVALSLNTLDALSAEGTTAAVWAPKQRQLQNFLNYLLLDRQENRDDGFKLKIMAPLD